MTFNRFHPTNMPIGGSMSFSLLILFGRFFVLFRFWYSSVGMHFQWGECMSSQNKTHRKTDFIEHINEMAKQRNDNGNGNGNDDFINESRRQNNYLEIGFTFSFELFTISSCVTFLLGILVECIYPPCMNTCSQIWYVDYKGVCVRHINLPQQFLCLLVFSSSPHSIRYVISLFHFFQTKTLTPCV